MEFRVERGKKAEGDRVVRVWSNGEIITLADILRLLDVIFRSEDNCYPIREGKQGRAYFMKAILEVYSGIPLEDVLKRYGLDGNGKPKPITKLHEVLE